MPVMLVFVNLIIIKADQYKPLLDSDQKCDDIDCISSLIGVPQDIYAILCILSL